MIRSVRWRIAFPYLLLILLAVIGLGVYLSRLACQTRLRGLESDLVRKARVIAAEVEPWLTGSEDPPSEALDVLVSDWADLLGVHLTVLTAEGTVVSDSHEGRGLADSQFFRPEIQRALGEGQGSSLRFMETFSDEVLYVALPVEGPAGPIGFVRLGSPLGPEEAYLVALPRVALAVGLTAAGLAVLLAVWIAGGITRPLHELMRAGQQLVDGDLSGSLMPRSHDEVGQLTRAFNAMASQVRRQFEVLSSERSKLAAVLQRMNDGVFIADGQGRIQLLNPAAGRMFNVRPEEALGGSLVEVLRNHELVDLWRRCQASGEEQVATLEMGLDRRTLQALATPLGRALPDHTLLVFQDLTRVRRLETVRRDFVSNISHELRTPLASLKALTETLRDGALDDPPAARRFLARMETELDALTQMVQELLELTRIESGRVPLQLQPMSPEALLKSALERLHLQADRAKLSVQITCREGLPAVLADLARIEQVLVNLLHNAIKFTPPGGEIELAAREIEGEVQFSVRDTGIGIPADDLPRIFERFYKIDRARSGGGTGLGLAIARHLVEAHGGRVWAESVEGRGSTFFFTLPASSRK